MKKTCQFIAGVACTLALIAVPLALLQAASPDVRSLDGWANNLSHPTWGNAHTPLKRHTFPEYDDGVSLPVWEDLPSAREVSNLMAEYSSDRKNTHKLSDWVWAWGQFIAHDMDLTPAEGESFPIAVPVGDPVFDPFHEGGKEIAFLRSRYDPRTGTGGVPREQMNESSSFIDASMVYGVSEERSNALRTFSGGRLKTSAGNLLPFNTIGLPNEIVGSDPHFFLAGDIRANENIVLSSLQTLFMREHNRLAAELALQHPDLRDEDLYQRARRIVGAEIQKITYDEFLPALLGKELPPYRGYNASVNPGIATEFSTAAFRLHTMISPLILRLQNDGTPIPQGNISLSEASMAPHALVETGIAPLLKGLSMQLAQEQNAYAIDALRNILFGPPGSPGTDIIARDIQRGRDHGLPDYNALRQGYGLPKLPSFSLLSQNRALTDKLQAAYGTVDSLDAFTGMMAEDHTFGSPVGPLISRVLEEQFIRLRAGDRFWYQDSLDRDALQKIEHTRLSDIVRSNTDLTLLQGNVFLIGPAEDIPPDTPGSPEDTPDDFPEPVLPPEPTLPEHTELEDLPEQIEAVQEKVQTVKDAIADLRARLLDRLHLELNLPAAR